MNLFYLSYLGLLLSGFSLIGSAAVPDLQRLTPEQEKHILQMNENTMTVFEVEFDNFKSFLRAYSIRRNGDWPKKWSDIEKDFKRTFRWDSDKQKEFEKQVVLLPGIAGQINSKEYGAFNGQMLVITAKSVQRDFSARTEQGRWALWRLPSGLIVRRWHPETELLTFSSRDILEQVLRTRPDQREPVGAFEASELPTTVNLKASTLEKAEANDEASPSGSPVRVWPTSPNQ